MDTQDVTDEYNQEDLAISEQLVTDAIIKHRDCGFINSLSASHCRSDSTFDAPVKDHSLTGYIRNKGRAWNASELAHLLDLSPKHIYRLAKEGRMPSIRIGGAIRFDPQATANWLEMKTSG